MSVLSSHGVQIQPMRVLAAGSSDAIRHTLKHFLDLHQSWGSIPPVAALTPEQGRVQLRAFGSIPTGHGVISMRFWEPPRREVMLRIHEQGYYPRYARLAQNAGQWGVRGAYWQKQEGKRWLADDVRGFRIVGDLDRTAFQVVTAYQLAVITESRSPQPGLFSIGARLGDLRQKLKSGESQEKDEDSP
jgi:hypothetical protein